jgi:hypothetical protein
VGTGVLIGGSRILSAVGFHGTLLNYQGNTDNIQSIVDFTLRDFGILSQNDGKGNGLYFNLNGNTRLNGLHSSLVENINIGGFQAGLTVRNSRLVKFSRISSWNNALDGTVFTNSNWCLIVQDGSPGTSDFCGDLTFDNCQFVARKDFYSKLVKLQAQSNSGIAGIRFTECIFYRGGGFSFEIFAFNSSQISDIWLDRCQFDDTTGTHIKLFSASALVTNINYTNNYHTAVAGNCIRIDSSIAVGRVNSVNVSENYSAGVFGSAAVQAIGVHGIHVDSNRWSGVAWSIGYVIGFLDCSQVVCTDNSASRAGPDLVGDFVSMVNLSGTGDRYVVTGNNACGLNTGPVVTNVTGAANVSIANNI